MTESAQPREPLEHRAANWLNGVMWYGLSSLATAFGLWTLVGSVWDTAAVLESLSFQRLEAIDSNRAWTGTALAASGLGCLLQTWRRKPATSP